MHFDASTSFIPSNWKPPENDVLKFNVDASFDAISNTLGTGVVLRSHTGDCEGVKGFYSNGVLSPEAGECTAILEALQWAKEKKLTRIQIEADAKLVVQSITDNVLLIQLENRNILKQIKNLSSSFIHCSFSFVSRNDNRVADLVAKTVRESATSLFLLSNFSGEICNLLARDINNISST
ncbi:uncharacterized protein LOC113337785 [Papaver somniferum]|uniref:uncharacterized protein LOC113337785 n=1 Tax=Papaver somniferum TaxID=3469 RepID=UPI000E704CF5|nr:uncharacterized protein LOC113337785 [Papaver somniferum]